MLLTLQSQWLWYYQQNAAYLEKWIEKTLAQTIEGDLTKVKWQLSTLTSVFPYFRALISDEALSKIEILFFLEVRERHLRGEIPIKFNRHHSSP